MNGTIQWPSTGNVRFLALLALVGGIAAVAVTGDVYWVVVAALVGSGALWVSSGDSGLSSADSDSAADALETLKQQYATGEIDESEFERRLETLIETETEDDQKQGSSLDPRPQSQRRSPDRSRCGPRSKKSHGRCR